MSSDFVHNFWGPFLCTYVSVLAFSIPRVFKIPFHRDTPLIANQCIEVLQDLLKQKLSYNFYR